jgi:DNA-binding NarL/FixJ family response regulator
MNDISILVVDDHPVYRDALCEKLSADFSPRSIPVVGVSDLEEAYAAIAKVNRSWLVLLDLKLPHSEPIANIRALSSLERVRNLVVISGVEEEFWESQCIAEGADVFISKNNTSDFIYMKLCELLNISNFKINQETPINLTKRQQDVFKLIVVGTSNKLIADHLGISEQTVKIHVSSIFRLLNVTNRTQAVYKAKMLRMV